MRILHVIPTLSPAYGGPAKACIEMARLMARRSHDVAIYTLLHYPISGEPDQPENWQQVASGVKVRFFPARFPRRWGYSPAMSQALDADVSGFDVVHIHSLFLHHFFAAGRASLRHHVPYIVRPHGSLDPFLAARGRGRKWLVNALFQDRLLRHAAAIHYTSEEERRQAEPYTFGRPAMIVPLGIDPKEFTDLPAFGAFRRRHRSVEDRKILLFLGRINYKKGLDILARAFGIIVRQRKDVHLVIAGPDNHGMQSRLKQWLIEEGVIDHVTFTGMVIGSEKLAILRDAHLFLLPSYTENFGIAVVEAMACGLPVVISDRVDIWREVEAAGAGKVTPCDAERFASAVLELLADDRYKQECGCRAAQAAKEVFDWERIGSGLERGYQTVVRGASAGQHQSNGSGRSGHGA